MLGIRVNTARHGKRQKQTIEVRRPRSNTLARSHGAVTRARQSTNRRRQPVLEIEVAAERLARVLGARRNWSTPAPAFDGHERCGMQQIEIADDAGLS
jgi:hypothetical protein